MRDVTLDEVKRLSVQRGDVVVVKVVGSADGELASIRHAVMHALPDGVEVLVTTEHVDFEAVYRPVPYEETP